MPWATDAEVKSALAAALKRDAAALPSYVDGIVAASVETAREQIRNATLALGYSESQLTVWSSLHSFHRHQSLYWSEVELREIFKDNEGELHARKNRLAELVKALTDTIVPDDPDPSAGGVSSGTLTSRTDFDTAVTRGRTCRGATDSVYRR